MEKFNKNFIVIIISIAVVGFLGGVVGELWVNSFLLPETYLNFSNYSDLAKKIDDLIETQGTQKQLDDLSKKVEWPINKARPSIVNIYQDKKFSGSVSETFNNSDVLGKGVIITNDGWIMTSQKVVKNKNLNYWISTQNQAVYQVERVIQDEKTGTVFVKVAANNLPVIEFDLKNNLLEGQTVFLMGLDNVLTNTIQNFNYSQLVKTSDYIHSSEEFYKFIKLQEGVTEQFLGCPVINSDGKMVGFVNNSEGEVYPVDYLLKTMKNLGKDKELSQIELGVYFYDLSEMINPKLKEIKGAMILEKNGFVKESVAVDSLQPGDIVLKVENEEITENKSLSEILYQYQVVENLKFTIKRGGEIMDITIDFSKVNQDIKDIDELQ